MDILEEVVVEIRNEGSRMAEECLEIGKADGNCSRGILNEYWNLGLEEFRDFKGEEFKND